MELKIDGQVCDLGTAPVAVPGYDAVKLASAESCREGRSLKITIPATPRNDALVGFACDPHTAVGFNDALHTAGAVGRRLGTDRRNGAPAGRVGGRSIHSKSVTEGPGGPKMPPAACFPD